jgi:hypothetical protein
MSYCRGACGDRRCEIKYYRLVKKAQRGCIPAQDQRTDEERADKSEPDASVSEVTVYGAHSENRRTSPDGDQVMPNSQTVREGKYQRNRAVP